MCLIKIKIQFEILFNVLICIGLEIEVMNKCGNSITKWLLLKKSIGLTSKGRQFDLNQYNFGSNLVTSEAIFLLSYQIYQAKYQSGIYLYLHIYGM